jgi:hypothetical protein
MFIALNTLDLWSLDDPANPADFFSGLGEILGETDILVVGSYGMENAAKCILESIEYNGEAASTPFSDTFNLNRDEYPDGKAWLLKANSRNLKALADCSSGGIDGLISSRFFDHLLAYRPGIPLIPLFDYHDAFNGGGLMLSGHYDRTTIEIFSRKLNVSFANIVNPEIKFMIECS